MLSTVQILPFSMTGQLCGANRDLSMSSTMLTEEIAGMYYAIPRTTI